MLPGSLESLTAVLGHRDHLEQAITGIQAHGAIDIAPTTGDKRHADVFAAREGCAVASEQIFVIDAPAGAIGFGGGKIIEILHPDGSRTGYYHLSQLADEINLLVPVPPVEVAAVCIGRSHVGHGMSVSVGVFGRMPLAWSSAAVSFSRKSS